MGFEEILFEVEDGVALVTLNRPQAMNALTMKTYAELRQAILRVKEEDEIRVMVITGAGRAFCSGDDVKQLMAAPDAAERRAEGRKRAKRVGPVDPVPPVLIELDKPVIAAVNGAAVGWGCDLALLCDIRIVSDKAKLGEIFVRRGLIPDLGGLYFLPLLVGLEKAYELLFTGDVVDAQEALRIGLVSRVVPHDDLMKETMAFAKRIAAGPPLAVQMSKQGLRRSFKPDLQKLTEYHHAALSILFETEDHKEGALAFMEKREPVFRGR